MGLMQRANDFVAGKLPVKLVRSRLTHAVASLTFDDFPKSAWSVGGPMLARYGARATYYAASRFEGLREDGVDYYDRGDVEALAASGHEVGAHSHGHEIAHRLTNRALRQDADRNAAAIEPWLGHRLSSYAYPYGAVTPRVKALMASRYACARGVRTGVNRGTIDLAQLLAVPIEARRWVPAEIDAIVADAAASAGWLIFFTHDVAEDPTPYGCTPSMLEYVLEAIAKAGIQVLPVRQAMAQATFGTADVD